MLLFVLPVFQFKFSVNTPSLPPLFQFPLRMNAATIPLRGLAPSRSLVDE
jgi:hypothetical protein